MVKTQERAIPDDPKLQDLYGTGQQQSNQEESQWGSNTDGVTEARDQWLTVMNICKLKGVYSDTSQLFKFVLFCFYFVFPVRGRLQGQRAYMKGQGDM